MDTMHSLSLHLPAALYERIQDAATRSDQSVEFVLVDSLTLLFGEPAVDWDQLAVTLDTLSDAQLWALVYRRQSPIARGRLRDLSAQGRHAPLRPDEQTELATLIDEADRAMLLRSRALVVLQQRGHPVQDQFQLGA